MINLLRSVRQRMLLQNKGFSYLLYAVGEILLVVVGILIALQIDTWNQDQQNRAIELETLRSLKEDLISADRQLDGKIVAAEDRELYETILLNHLQVRQPDIDADSLNALVVRFLNPPTFDPEMGTINEIISTGKLNLIKNTNIRSFITSWNMNMSEIKEVENAIIENLENKKEPLFYDYFAYRNTMTSLGPSSIDWDPEPLLNDIRFENITIKSLSLYGLLLRRQQRLNAIISRALSEIETDIQRLTND